MTPFCKRASIRDRLVGSCQFFLTFSSDDATFSPEQKFRVFNALSTRGLNEFICLITVVSDIVFKIYTFYRNNLD